jgi:hypothetical protein
VTEKNAERSENTSWRKVPLLPQFSGTVFYRDAVRALQAAPIPWHNEAMHKPPVMLWRCGAT